jgi:hypothetical protein
MADEIWNNVMAVVTWYQNGIEAVAERSVAFTGWTAASIKVALVTSSYVPSQSHTSYANVSAYEISGGDYTLGGQALSGKTISTNQNQLQLDAIDIAWASLPVKPRYAIIYDSTNVTASLCTLMGYLDLGNLKGRKLRIRWPSTGVLTLTVENAVGFP